MLNAAALAGKSGSGAAMMDDGSALLMDDGKGEEDAKTYP